MQGKRKIIGKINGLRNYCGSELGAYRISMVKLNHDGSEETKITHPGRWLNFGGLPRRTRRLLQKAWKKRCQRMNYGQF